METRELWASTQMNEWFERDWTGIAQIFRIRRCVKEAEHEHEEVVYGVTYLPPKKVNASRLLSLQQEHWRIENRLHYRRDVTLDEDACQVRVAGAPQALVALNGGVLALSGLVAGAECGFAYAPFLCSSAQSPTITV